MEFESVLISAALALAVLPLLLVALASWKNAALAALLVFGVALPVVTLARHEYLSPTAIDPDVLDRPTVAPHDDYVSSSRCRSCHPAEYASWDHSYHQSMTQEAVEGAVVGNFDDVTLTTMHEVDSNQQGSIRQ